MFRFMQSNRKISQGLVKRLINSILELGYVEARPIIVDQSMTIIDGQHRFEACKKLGIPIVYEISDIDPKKAMVGLNMNQQIWRLNEYINSWAAEGIECYKEIVDFEEKYKLGISNTLVICQSVRNGRKTNSIREGKEFELSPYRFKVAEFVLACKPHIPFYKTNPFVASINLLFKKTTEDNCNKVLSRIQSLKQQPTQTDYLAVYQNILNKYKKYDENKIILI